MPCCKTNEASQKQQRWVGVKGTAANELSRMNLQARDSPPTWELRVYFAHRALVCAGDSKHTSVQMKEEKVQPLRKKRTQNRMLGCLCVHSYSQPSGPQPAALSEEPVSTCVQDRNVMSRIFAVNLLTKKRRMRLRAPICPLWNQYSEDKRKNIGFNEDPATITTWQCCQQIFSFFTILVSHSLLWFGFGSAKCIRKQCCSPCRGKDPSSYRRGSFVGWSCFDPKEPNLFPLFPRSLSPHQNQVLSSESALHWPVQVHR